MKTVHGMTTRTIPMDMTIEGNGFSYKLEDSWAKLPARLQGIHISGGACDNVGNLFVGTRNSEYPIIVFDSRGNVIRTMGKGLFAYTHSICITPWDTLLCADSSKGGHVVRELTLEGDLIRDFGTFGRPSETGYNPDAFMQAKQDGRIPPDEPWEDKLEFHLMLETIQYVGGPCNRPTGAAIGRNDIIYISDGYGNCAIHKFDRKGTLIKTWGAPGETLGAFRCPHAVWVDAQERVFVCDRENARVQVFSTNGVTTAVIDNLMTTGSIWSNNSHIFIGEFGGMTILSLDLEIVAQFGFERLGLRCHGLCGNAKNELFIMSRGNLFKMVPLYT